MEPKFVNECTQTKEILYELYRSMYSKASSVIYTVFFFISILGGIAFIVWLDDKVLGLYLLIIALLTAFMRFLSPTLYANRVLKKNELISGGKEPIKVELSFYETNLKTFFAATNETLDISYDKIKKMIVTKNLYILSFEGRIYIAVSRSGFTVGTAEEFEAFIKGKIKK